MNGKHASGSGLIDHVHTLSEHLPVCARVLDDLVEVHTCSTRILSMNCLQRTRSVSQRGNSASNRSLQLLSLGLHRATSCSMLVVPSKSVGEGLAQEGMETFMCIETQALGFEWFHLRNKYSHALRWGCSRVTERHRTRNRVTCTQLSQVLTCRKDLRTVNSRSVNPSGGRRKWRRTGDEDGKDHSASILFGWNTVKSYCTGSRPKRKRSCNGAKDGEGPMGHSYSLLPPMKTSITVCRALQ